MEVPKSTPVAFLYLELGILPAKYDIESKQLLFLKLILDKEADDPVLLSYQEMLKFGSEEMSRDVEVWFRSQLGK